MTKGGVSYGDSENMTPYERKLAMDAMKEILDEQKRLQDQAIENARLQQQNDVPKSGLHH